MMHINTKLCKNCNLSSESVKLCMKCNSNFTTVAQNMLELLEDMPKGVPIELARGYVYQLCRAVSWCHNNGIIHRGFAIINLFWY